MNFLCPRETYTYHGYQTRPVMDIYKSKEMVKWFQILNTVVILNSVSISNKAFLYV